MAELLIEDNNKNKFLMVSTTTDIYLAKIIEQEGFFHFENVPYHSFDFKDIHQLVHHGKCRNFTLVENYKDKSLPLHILDF